MKRVLYLSDGQTRELEQRLKFIHGWTAKTTTSITNVRQTSHDTLPDGTLIHLNQSPITTSSTATTDYLLNIMARPPYNLHDNWLKQFDLILVTYYDVSKKDRFIHTIQ